MWCVRVCVNASQVHVEQVNILKSLGGGVKESVFVKVSTV